MPWSSKTHLPLKETVVRSLDQEDPLEEGMATHSSLLAWRIPLTEVPGGITGGPWGRTESDRTEPLKDNRNTLTHGASSGMTDGLDHSSYPSPQPPAKL